MDSGLRTQDRDIPTRFRFDLHLQNAGCFFFYSSALDLSDSGLLLDIRAASLSEQGQHPQTPLPLYLAVSIFKNMLQSTNKQEEDEEDTRWRHADAGSRKPTATCVEGIAVHVPRAMEY